MWLETIKLNVWLPQLQGGRSHFDFFFHERVLRRERKRLVRELVGTKLSRLDVLCAAERVVQCENHREDEQTEGDAARELYVLECTVRPPLLLEQSKLTLDEYSGTSHIWRVKVGTQKVRLSEEL